jgi:hypothetical protein
MNNVEEKPPSMQLSDAVCGIIENMNVRNL